MKLNAKELRTTRSTSSAKKSLKKNPIFIIVDNVLDTYNVGAIFRLADAVAAEKVILTGNTETPPHTRIKKASINTTEWVEWEYEESASIAIKKLKTQSPEVKVVAIEQAEGSVSFDNYEYKFPIAFIIGHESDGVSREAMEASDAIVELPMFGVNKSLNVMVSLGIVLYHSVKYLPR